MWLDVFRHYFIIDLDRKLCSQPCFLLFFSGVCCPYNGLFAIPLVLVIIAHLLFNYAAFGCQTFQVQVENEYFGFWTYEDEYFGFWTYEDEDGECQSFDDLGGDPDWDAAWKIGRAATVIGSVLSYVLVIMLLVNSCVRYPRMLFILMAVAMFIVALMSGLLLVGLASDFYLDHGFGPGLGVALAAFVLWNAAGVSMFFCMKERNNLNSMGGHQQAAVAQPTYATRSAYTYPSQAPVAMTAAVPMQDGAVVEEVVIVEHPDGSKTKTTTTTTTTPDGSKQIVKFVEEIQ